MRLRRRRLCLPPAARPRHRLPGVGEAATICALLTALQAFRPIFPRGSLPLRCGQRRSSRRSSGPCPPFTKRAQRSCHASCGPPPGESESGRRSASGDFRGGFAMAELGGAASLDRSPPLNRRGAWKEERKVFRSAAGQKGEAWRATVAGFDKAIRSSSFYAWPNSPTVT
jgi:hypothetical protein